MAGNVGLYYSGKTIFDVDGQLIINKGYGLLVISDMTRGLTAIYAIRNGIASALNQAIDDVTIERISEFAISIKNTGGTKKNMSVSFIGI